MAEFYCCRAFVHINRGIWMGVMNALLTLKSATSTDDVVRSLLASPDDQELADLLAGWESHRIAVSGVSAGAPGHALVARIDALLAEQLTYSVTWLTMPADSGDAEASARITFARRE